MTGIDPQVAFQGCFCGTDERGNSLFPAGGEIPGISFGIQFYPVGTGIGSMADHHRICFDEYGGPDTMPLEPGHYLFQKFRMSDGIPACVGGQYTRRIGDQCYLVGQDLQHQINKTGRRVTLDIEFGLNQGFQVTYILVTYVPFVGTRMHRDTLRSEPFTIRSSFQHIGQVSAAGIAECGYFIDIYTKPGHYFKFVQNYNKSYFYRRLFDISAMRTVIQRVLSASVTIGDRTTGPIGSGLLIFLGIEESDDLTDVEWLSAKIVNLRIFNDPRGVMNLSVAETGGELLVVSQFTLHASTRKGNRPSYIRAARPDKAVPLYEGFIRRLQELTGKPVKTGEFGAMMQVRLLNDGPVTILIDTKNKE